MKEAQDLRPPATSGAGLALRKEPYRVFFPLGLVLAAAGVVPWLLFARGLTPVWPGEAHALIMSQGFFLAVAVGFLGTMLPRRTGRPPLGGAALAALAGGTILSSAALLAGAPIVAELAYLASFAIVAAWARLRGAPPSFVLVPFGAALGALGAAAIIAASAGAPAWTVTLGRALVAQGLMLCLVLAVAPVLVPAILGGKVGQGAGRAWPHAAAGLLIAASFPVEQWISPRAGVLVRGAVCAAALVAAGVLAPAARGGAHRAAFRLALLLVPLGLLASGLFPERRVALAHVTYVGGFALLILAVTVHVTFTHGGRAEKIDRWPAGVVIATALVLAAAAARTMLEGAGARYLDAMALASTLWLLAVAAWGATLAPALRRR
jgi:uncharacterized protein involved in response to NO